MLQYTKRPAGLLLIDILESLRSIHLDANYYMTSIYASLESRLR